jgi:hypothetical protein
MLGDAEPAAGAASEDGPNSSSGSSGKRRRNQGHTGLLPVARAIGDRSAIRGGGRVEAGVTARDVHASRPVPPELGTTERPTPCGVVAVGDTADGGCSGTATPAGRVSTEAAGIATGVGAAAGCEGSARDSGRGGGAEADGARAGGAGAATTGANTGVGACTGAGGACSAGGGGGGGTTRRGGRSPSGST